MKRPSKLDWMVMVAWLILLGSFVAIVAGTSAGANRTAAGNIFLCLIPLIVNAALLANATTAHWRRNAFWMLLAFGCSLWLVGQFIWTYLEVYHHLLVPDPHGADILFFLHAVPMIAALTLQPHKRSGESSAMFGHVDFALITCWWIYLYTFVVLPWQFAVVDDKQYVQAYTIISAFENLIFVVGAGMLVMQATGSWRRVYAYLMGSRLVYAVGLLAVRLFMTGHSYSRVSLQTLPVIVSLLLMGSAGVSAYRHIAEQQNDESPLHGSPGGNQLAGENILASRMARGALLSLPLIGFWCLKVSVVPAPVHSFRLMITLGAVLPLGFLAFLRHELMDAERLQLLRASQESLDNLKRLQTQFVQSEKLASIGQLVGGAAHEINNPLTAILGYSELLADDPSADSRSRSLAEKIREQAKRTKALVNNLLIFARQSPSEQLNPLDLNTIVNSAVQFRRIDLRGKNIRFEIQNGSNIPEVRGDANQLLQVFCNIINNAADALEEVGGGTLTVRTLFEKGNAVVIFSDTGKGMREPHLVFDPFYTTKPVGKGTGLGLSICYGLVHEQGGKISCQNRPGGGAMFRVELPAVPTLFSQRALNTTSQDNPAKMA
jgi:signal transduction histidine kinase